MDKIFLRYVVAPILLVGILLFFFNIRCADAGELQPVGFNKWADGNKRIATIGQLCQNYQDSLGQWHEIDTVWQEVNDTLWSCSNAVLRTWASSSGGSAIKIKIGGRQILIKKYLDRFVLVDTVTWNHQSFHVGWDWPEPTVSGRDILWSFPGWKYRIRKERGATAEQVMFQPGFLDSLITVYGTLPLVARNRVALGTVFRYEFNGVPDSVLINMPRARWKRLARFGAVRKVLDLSHQRLHFPGYDTLPEIPVMQEWKHIRGRFYLCEYVMMKHLDTLHTVFPNMAVWHAATTTIGGDDDVEDTWLDGDNTCENNGHADNIVIGDDDGSGDPDSVGLIRCWDVASSVGANATIDSAYLKILSSTITNPGNVSAYAVMKPWVEGKYDGTIPPNGDSGAAHSGWDIYAFRLGCVGSRWAVNGCACGRSNAEPNSYAFSAQDCVDSTADYDSDVLDTEDIQKSSTWYYFYCTTAMQNWYDGTWDENGLLLTPGQYVSVEFVQTEKAWTPNSGDPGPVFYIYYTVSEETGQVILIN